MASAESCRTGGRRMRRRTTRGSTICWNTSRAAQPSGRWRMDDRLAYLRDGAAIYQRSFAIIRAEADLVRFSPEEADVVVRMIHACGLVEAARHIVFGGGLVAAARNALAAGGPVPWGAGNAAHGHRRA